MSSFAGSQAFSADAFLRPYTDTRYQPNKSSDEVRSAGETKNSALTKLHGRFFWFRPKDQEACDDTDKENCDSILGSLSVARGGDTQTIKLNAVNYNLWLGGKLYLPFQVYVAQDSSTNGGAEGQSETNKTKIFDPESGLAVRVPLYWNVRYENGLCDFMKDDKSTGSCFFGSDISLHAREMKVVADGSNKVAYGFTLRAGAAVRFPVLESKDKKEEAGYLAFGVRYIYARTNLDDSSKLFTPVKDASNNTVSFRNSAQAVEFETMFAVDKQFGFSVRVVSPLADRDLYKDQVRVSLDALF